MGSACTICRQQHRLVTSSQNKSITSSIGSSGTGDPPPVHQQPSHSGDPVKNHARLIRNDDDDDEDDETESMEEDKPSLHPILPPPGGSVNKKMGSNTRAPRPIALQHSNQSWKSTTSSSTSSSSNSALHMGQGDLVLGHKRPLPVVPDTPITPMSPQDGFDLTDRSRPPSAGLYKTSSGVSLSQDRLTPSDDGRTSSMTSVLRRSSVNSVMSTRSELETPRHHVTQIEQHKVVRGYSSDGTKMVNQYTILKNIGEGAFAKVKLVMHEPTKTQYALKIMNKDRLSRKIRGKGLTELHYALREIEIMKTIQHPNLVRLHEVLNSEDSAKLYLVLEYVPKGPICKTPDNEYAAPSSPYTENDMRNISLLRSYANDMLCALTTLHAQNIQHRDIKPENVLLDQNDTVKLGDFGVSSLLESELDVVSTRDGTPLFFSPEMLAGGAYHGKPCDVWSLGLTLYMVAFGRSPFPRESLVILVRAISEREVCCPPCAPPLLCDLIYRMLTKEPSLRITARQALGHPFIRDRVPFSLSVRVWKEQKLSNSGILRKSIFSSPNSSPLTIQDTTDQSFRSSVDLTAIVKGWLPFQGGGAAAQPNSAVGETTPEDRNINIQVPQEGGVESDDENAASPLAEAIGEDLIDDSVEELLIQEDLPADQMFSTNWYSKAGRGKSIINQFHDASTVKLGFGRTNGGKYLAAVGRKHPPKVFPYTDS